MKTFRPATLFPALLLPLLLLCGLPPAAQAQTSPQIITLPTELTHIKQGELKIPSCIA